jgi:hypothetical protein
MRSRRGSEAEARLRSAKDKYRTAMLSTLTPIKSSADVAGGVRELLDAQGPLDDAAALVTRTDEKRASWMDYVWNPCLAAPGLCQSALPYYVLGAGALGAPLASLSYGYTRQLDPEREKAKRLQKQIEMGLHRKPSPVYARLVPVDESGKRLHPREVKLIERERQRAAPEDGLDKPASDNPLEKKAREFVSRLLARRHS